MFSKINKIICKYLGIAEVELDRPQLVTFIENNLIIQNNSPFQRHKTFDTWESINKDYLNKISAINQKKLGIALGKALANNLIISFEDFKIE